ncbi:MAG TPA: hypothetical protein VEQ40_08425 [Pyrinomonadaceae bacterium]|nr:hypothetical protein [Pyrinomonadaceae bacterium]
MKQKLFITQRACLTLAAFILTGLVAADAFAQSQTLQPAAAPAIEEKAEKILQRAIGAMGGSAYLSVRSSIGRGLFTPFREGVSGLPASFIDYIVYPDKERTEFRGGGMKVIQTNTGETGWIYDGAAKTLKDMTPKQVADFKMAMRTNVDNLLRGVWRKEGAQVAYAGRREAGLAKRNEAVRVTYPDGFIVEFEFSAQDGLPAKILYKRTNSDGEEIAEEDRLAQFVTTNGISSPFVIDHYIAGMQTSRINYQSIEFNTALADTLFARPASVKAVK